MDQELQQTLLALQDSINDINKKMEEGFSTVGKSFSDVSKKLEKNRF
ncbi:hypothetical protein [Geomicrobium sp. JCM 19055]|nr:hypothetical protein [Geomicrobium sp. JCM 19055]